jgi:hypothetical protein
MIEDFAFGVGIPILIVFGGVAGLALAGTFVWPAVRAKWGSRR